MLSCTVLTGPIKHTELVRNSRTASAIYDWLLRPIPTFAVRSISQYSSALATAQGRVRDDNQDRIVAVSFEGPDQREAFEFFAVCDGMGGMQEGGACASLAVARMVTHLLATRREFDRAARLRFAVEAANAAIYQRYGERGGTTVTAVLLTRNGGTGVAVGDTRLYLHESTEVVTQMSVDDTLAARLVEIQGADERSGQVEQGPYANHLAQFVGQSGMVRPQIIDLRPVFSDQPAGPRGERAKGVLITSDGIHRMAKQTFSDLVRHADSPKEAVGRLMHVSEWSGGHDNQSALYIAAGPRASMGVRANREFPSLLIQDPFGDFQLAFSSPDELRELADSGVREHLRPEGFYRGTSSLDRTSLYGDKPNAGNSGAVENKPAPAIDVSQSKDNESDSESRPPRAHATNSIHTRAESRLAKSEPSSKRPQGRQTTKSRRKQGKGKKGKGRGREDRDPQFDILISEEPE